MGPRQYARAPAAAAAVDEAARQVNVGARTTCSPPGVGCDRPWFVCAVDRRCEPDLGLRLREAPVNSELLYHNEWVSLHAVREPEHGVNGYIYSHETRCAGRIVALLPYRENGPEREYLLKSEMTPCWGLDQVLSSITGGYEGGDIEDDAVREMLEETGYTIGRDELIPLGESYASKSSDTIYTLFSVDLTGRTAGEAIGDGSRVESESAAVWMAARDLAEILDPQVAVMYLRLLTSK